MVVSAVGLEVGVGGRVTYNDSFPRASLSSVCECTGDYHVAVHKIENCEVVTSKNKDCLFSSLSPH